MRRGLLLVAAVAALSGGAAVAIAAVSAPEDVKTSTTAHEQAPAASVDWFAWTQRPFAHPRRANVFAEPMPLGGADRFRVNPKGTTAWTGGIDGDILVYQRVTNNRSNIRLFDLVSKTDISAAAVNTRQWEWHPTISTDSNTEQWVLFGRQNLGTGVQRVLATNLDTGQTRSLGRVNRFRYVAIPGQVNGDWATWTVCRPRCNVRFIDLSDPSSTPVPIPKPSSVTHQYASSITADGTVYFVRSGNGCGKAVRIVRYDPVNHRVPVSSLPDGRDIFFSYISDEPVGNHVYYDRVICSSGRWNIYRIVETP
jgi:hypothetical protein